MGNTSSPLPHAGSTDGHQGGLTTRDPVYSALLRVKMKKAPEAADWSDTTDTYATGSSQGRPDVRDLTYDFPNSLVFFFQHSIVSPSQI